MSDLATEERDGRGHFAVRLIPRASRNAIAGVEALAVLLLWHVRLLSAIRPPVSRAVCAGHRGR
jgi:hypothetical protein